MLYYPWYKEITDLLVAILPMRSIIIRRNTLYIYANEQKFTLADIEGIEIEEDNVPEHG